MAIEAATYISELDPTSPDGAVERVPALGDNVRLIKSVLLQSFRGVTGKVTASHTALNTVGVTQPQSSNNGSVASTAYTNTAVATAFVSNVAPISAGVAGKYLTNDGASVSWGALQMPMQRSARTADVPLGATDRGSLIDVTSGTFIQTFAASSTLGDGWWCVYRNSGTGTVVLVPNGVETIDGATALNVFPGQTVLVNSDGSNLRTVFLSGDRLLIVRDEKASGTAGGSSTSGAYNTRTLNTIATNTISGATLSADQIILPAGKYTVLATCPASGSDNHKARLYNVTASAVLLVGTSEQGKSSGITTRTVLAGPFTLATTSAVRLEHRVSTSRATTGLGAATSFGNVEVYSEIVIERVDSC